MGGAATQMMRKWLKDAPPVWDGYHVAVGSNGLGADLTLDRCCAAVRSIGILALA